MKVEGALSGFDQMAIPSGAIEGGVDGWNLQAHNLRIEVSIFISGMSRNLLVTLKLRGRSCVSPAVPSRWFGNRLGITGNAGGHEGFSFGGVDRRAPDRPYVWWAARVRSLGVYGGGRRACRPSLSLHFSQTKIMKKLATLIRNPYVILLQDHVEDLECCWVPRDVHIVCVL